MLPNRCILLRCLGRGIGRFQPGPSDIEQGDHLQQSRGKRGLEMKQLMEVYVDDFPHSFGEFNIK